MFKRLLCMFLFAIFIMGIWTMNVQPIFKDYGNVYQVFLNESSSLAKVVSVDKAGFRKLKGIKGESCKVNADNFNLNEFLLDYSASVIFIEEIQEGVSYYAYTPKINYREEIFGKTINLHVFVGKNQVTMGTPIIYGSF